MTDTEELRSLINESGLKFVFIADKLNITTEALRRKITNRSEFKASEIKTLCTLLKIKGERNINKIFFAD